MVRWNGESREVNAPAKKLDLTLENGTSYRFTVEARNGFEADGGVSGASNESNSVRPYKKPAAPTSATITPGKCTGANSCPVKFAATANSGDGGAGNKTLQVRVNGGDWVDSGTSYSNTVEVKSGQAQSIEARVVTKPKNADGSTATMTSETLSVSRDAQTYTPPAPVSSINWGPHATLQGVCTGQFCRRVDIEITNLDPSKTYEMTIKTNPNPASPNDGGWWTKNNAPVTVNPDANGNYTTAAKSQFYYGYPDNTFTVYLDGKPLETHSYKPL
ncbi:hypothetical protein [Brachybacterium sp. Z12]|uniref:hypothetical protein n=1 Tax=Brachybacterium sp. Z12 TaxID=2759167 RepID=UPI00223C170A|nr:hypothetical protein [Brachybacterium sp. Z12]